MAAEGDVRASIEFVVGEEKRITDIMSESEALSLLESAIKAGASEASILDGDGAVLWTRRTAGEGSSLETLPLHIEGEVCGRLRLKAGKDNGALLPGVARFLADIINAVLANNLKRMLTTEIHTKVVNESYGELLEANRRLQASEQKYRELAESLDRKVQERTEELRRAHLKLLQQEKMASIGQLAAGVAHEINNPMGFISSNINTLDKYVYRMIRMVEFYRSALSGDGHGKEVFGEGERLRRELKLDYVIEDARGLIKESLDGALRVKKIVSDLKGFSHVDDIGENAVDINVELDRALSVLCHELKGAEVRRDYGALPVFKCRPAALSQVFLNVILNAVQAKGEGLALRIRTAEEDGSIKVEVSDNGPGIPEEVRDRIFEPFYTTRDVGKGAGLGLAVAYDTITSLGGAIEVESRPGEGTDFIITLPATKGKDVKIR